MPGDLAMQREWKDHLRGKIRVVFLWDFAHCDFSCQIHRVGITASSERVTHFGTVIVPLCYLCELVKLELLGTGI